MSVLYVLILSILLIPAESALSADYAEQLYMDYCSVCHGERGDGNSRVRQGLDPPPRDFTQPGLLQSLPRERVIEVIRNGKPGTAMVGWSTQLSDSQIERIADFVMQRFMGVGAKMVSEGAKMHVSPHDRGKLIYATSCSVCHGEEGKGALWGRQSLNPPPVDFTAPAVQKRLSRERMLLSVTHGRPGTAMAAFSSQLSAQDITATVDYIRKEFMGLAIDTAQVAQNPAGDTVHVKQTESAKRHAAQRVADKSAPMPGGLSGDPKIGHGYYLQNCTACHGEAGDGKGPRAYFIFPKPRNFLAPGVRAAFNRPRLFAAIRDGVIGKEMPAWGKVLDEQTIAHVTEYVYQAFINSDRTQAAQD